MLSFHNKYTYENDFVKAFPNTESFFIFIVSMSEFLPINKWAEDDRPREKLIAKGKQSLSDAELIAILISTGTKKKSAVDVAKSLLNRSQNSLDALSRMDLKELMHEEGIGEAKAITIMAALELGNRRKSADVNQSNTIKSSRDIYSYYQQHLSDLNVEHFRVMYLNRANRILQEEQVSAGGISGTVADPRVIVKKAILLNCSSAILCHNHPSGNLKPSAQDIGLTKKLKEGFALFDILLLDHLIFTDNGYYSFADEGLL